MNEKKKKYDDNVAEASRPCEGAVTTAMTIVDEVVPWDVSPILLRREEEVCLELEDQVGKSHP